jgi:hypothetical protein
MSVLYKNTGRTTVTQNVTTTRRVWVEDPPASLSPPITPPIGESVPPAGGLVPFVGYSLINCESEGQLGKKLIYTDETGRITYLSDCLINDSP